MGNEENKMQVIHSGWFALIGYLLAGISLVVAIDTRSSIAREGDRAAECYTESKRCSDSLAICYAQQATTRDELKEMWGIIRLITKGQQ